jgi:GNAT superfamily N-acetyltransferase
MTALLFEDMWLPLDDAEPVSSRAQVDDVTTELVGGFDFAWDGDSRFVPALVPHNLPEDYGIGVIVGASGSGKSMMLRDFAVPSEPDWSPDRSIASHFDSPEDARSRLLAVGLNSVPAWVKPYNVLSTGERFRADLARTIGTGAVVDEFTSVVDRAVAESASCALSRWVETQGARRLTIATCHRDVIPWLRPDWIIDLDTRCWAYRPRECLQRPERVVEIYAGTRAAWDVFGGHHYLSGDIHKGARCFVAVMDGRLVGFVATLAFPNGYIRNGWRAHRTVVLPDFQGMGIGSRLSDWVAEFHRREGRRYFSRTAHPRLVAHRDESSAWRPTSHSGELRRTGGYRAARWESPTNRVGHSHEWVGEKAA